MVNNLPVKEVGRSISRSRGCMTRICSVVTLSLLLCGVLQAADIEGTIIVKRKLTKPKVTAVANSYERGPAVPLDADHEEDPLAAERSRVVLYLESDKLPSRSVTATLEQKNRRFGPSDVLVVPVGSTVSFPNLDDIFHNVFSLSKPKSFDLGNYAKNQTRTVTFTKPGLVFVNCHLHPNMSAVIVVTPNRWAVKATPSGKFVLPQVPPGKYTLVAWHKAAGFFRQEVTVTDKGISGIEFLIPLESAN
jgi:plastocyanin